MRSGDTHQMTGRLVNHLRSTVHCLVQGYHFAADENYCLHSTQTTLQAVAVETEAAAAVVVVAAAAAADGVSGENGNEKEEQEEVEEDADAVLGAVASAAVNLAEVMQDADSSDSNGSVRSTYVGVVA